MKHTILLILGISMLIGLADVLVIVSSPKVGGNDLDCTFTELKFEKNYSSEFDLRISGLYQNNTLTGIYETLCIERPNELDPVVPFYKILVAGMDLLDNLILQGAFNYYYLSEHPCSRENATYRCLLDNLPSAVGFNELIPESFLYSEHTRVPPSLNYKRVASKKLMHNLGAHLAISGIDLHNKISLSYILHYDGIYNMTKLNISAQRHDEYGHTYYDNYTIPSRSLEERRQFLGNWLDYTFRTSEFTTSVFYPDYSVEPVVYYFSYQKHYQTMFIIMDGFARDERFEALVDGRKHDYELYYPIMFVNNVSLDAGNHKLVLGQGESKWEMEFRINPDDFSLGDSVLCENDLAKLLFYGTPGYTYTINDIRLSTSNYSCAFDIPTNISIPKGANLFNKSIDYDRVLNLSCSGEIEARQKYIFDLDLKYTRYTNNQPEEITITEKLLMVPWECD